MLPRLSKVHDCIHWIYFFIEIDREVLYAYTEEDTPYWWVEAVNPWISDKKGV